MKSERANAADPGTRSPTRLRDLLGAGLRVRSYLARSSRRLGRRRKPKLP
jgi:hypothetical protein